MKNILTSLLVNLIFGFSLNAQSVIEGSISNTVGQELAETTVKLVNLENTQLSQEVTTDADGYFFVENLANGKYQLEVQNAQYETVVIENFQFPRDTDQVVGLQMEATNISSTIGLEKQRPEGNVALAKVH